MCVLSTSIFSTLFHFLWVVVWSTSRVQDSVQAFVDECLYSCVLCVLRHVSDP